MLTADITPETRAVVRSLRFIPGIELLAGWTEARTLWLNLQGFADNGVDTLNDMSDAEYNVRSYALNAFDQRVDWREVRACLKGGTTL